MKIQRFLRTLVRATCYFAQDNALDLIATIGLPVTGRAARALFGTIESPWLTSSLWGSSTVDGAVVGGVIPTAGAKYTLPKGLPKQGQRVLAIENEPHLVDGFSGTIESGYGKGTKKLLVDDKIVVKIGTKTFLSRFNYHEHDADRAGLHYDLSVADLPPGTKKFEINVPRGEYKGRYAFVTTKKGVIVVPMVDNGLVIAKPDYTLKSADFLEQVKSENAEALGRWFVGQKFDRDPIPRYYLDQKIDGSLANVLIKDSRAIFRSHRDTGGTYYDKVPQLEDLSNHSRVWLCRRAFPGPRLDGTVLRVELYHPDGPGRMGGILNAMPDRAQEIQVLRGPAQVYGWDIVKLRGRDISHLPYYQRKAIRAKVIDEIRLFNSNWHDVPTCDPFGDPIKFYQTVIALGLPLGEGVVIKDAYAPMGTKWWKVKPTDHVDLEILEVQAGSGKYANSTGRMVVRNPVNDAVGEIGSFAITDERRQWIYEHRDIVPGSYGKFRVQEMTQRGAPRAGVFVDFHEGKGSTEAPLVMYAESLAGGDPKATMETKYALISSAGWRKR